MNEESSQEVKSIKNYNHEAANLIEACGLDLECIPKELEKIMSFGPRPSKEIEAIEDATYLAPREVIVIAYLLGASTIEAQMKNSHMALQAIIKAQGEELKKLRGEKNIILQGER